MNYHKNDDDSLTYGVILGLISAVITLGIFIHYNHFFIGLFVSFISIYPYMAIFTIVIDFIRDKMFERKKAKKPSGLINNPNYQFSSERSKNAAKLFAQFFLSSFEQMEISSYPYTLSEAGDAIASHSYPIEDYNSDFCIYYHLIFDSMPYFDYIYPYFSSNQEEKNRIEKIFLSCFLNRNVTDECIEKVKETIDFYDLFKAVKEVRRDSWNHYIITYPLRILPEFKGGSRKYLLDDAGNYISDELSSYLSVHMDPEGTRVTVFYDTKNNNQTETIPGNSNISKDAYITRQKNEDGKPKFVVYFDDDNGQISTPNMNKSEKSSEDIDLRIELNSNSKPESTKKPFRVTIDSDDYL